MVELMGGFNSQNSSLLHRIDARFKVAILLLLSTSSIYSGFTGLSVLLIAQVLIVYAAPISVIKLIRELKIFFIFLGFVFCARALSTPGEKLFRIDFLHMGLMVTQQGVLSGALICFRLFLVVMLGYLFIWSTFSSQIRAAVAWYLKPVPWIPEKRVAFMLSLLIRFLPMIVQEAREISDAQRARCIENRKNPVYRFVKVAVPMIRKIFLRAEDLVLAMEARGYSENRTLPHLYSKKSDWFLFAFVVILSLIMIQI